MKYNLSSPALETKFHAFGDETTMDSQSVISGYASLFGQPDQSNDIVQKGAYSACLKRLGIAKRQVKMLWQHDPSKPIGVWDQIYEDERGLFVKGRLLTDIQLGREAACLIEAGAIDGLSIGYRTLRSKKADNASRLLEDIDLWEVSLVTFPMLPEARVEGSEIDSQLACDLAQVIADARRELLA